MKKEMYMRAVKVLLIQARYDLLAIRNKYHEWKRDPRTMSKPKFNFCSAIVIGNRIFLTEDAAAYWPNRKGHLRETVMLDDAIQYADTHPDYLKEISDEYNASNRFKESLK